MNKETLEKYLQDHNLNPEDTFQELDINALEVYDKRELHKANELYDVHVIYSITNNVNSLRMVNVFVDHANLSLVSCNAPVFSNCIFKDAVFKKCTFNYATFFNCRFESTCFIGTSFKMMYMINCTFDDYCMFETNHLTGAHILGTELDLKKLEDNHNDIDNIEYINSNLLEKLATLPTIDEGDEEDMIKEIIENKNYQGELELKDLKNKVFSKCIFYQGNIEENSFIDTFTDFKECEFHNFIFKHGEYQKIIFDHSSFHEVTFDGNYQWCSFIYCSFDDCKFEDTARFAGCNFAFSDIDQYVEKHPDIFVEVELVKEDKSKDSTILELQEQLDSYKKDMEEAIVKLETLTQENSTLKSKKDNQEAVTMAVNALYEVLKENDNTYKELEEKAQEAENKQEFNDNTVIEYIIDKKPEEFAKMISKLYVKFGDLAKGNKTGW